MAGRLAGADYSAGPLIGSGVDFRPCVNDEHDHRTDDPNGLPTFFTRVHVRTAGSQRIVEHQLSSFKAQAVAKLIEPFFFSVSKPPQSAAPFFFLPYNYKFVVT
jgi:hypothetical protein